MNYKSGVAMVLMAGVLWSFQGLIIRQMAEAGSWSVLFWRSVGMLPALSLFFIWRSNGTALAALRKAGTAGFLGGLGLVVAMGGAIVAFQTTTVANAAFLFAASPFFAAILGRIILAETVSSQTWTAIGIALVGITIRVGDGLAAGAWLGNLAALLASLGFAGFTVTLRWRRVDDSLPFSIIGAVFSILTGAVMAGVTGEPLLVPAADVLWCLLMGVFTLSGGMILYTLGSKVVPSAELTLLSNTEVLLAPIWVWLLLGESGTDGTLLGGAVLLVAILFNAYSGAKRNLLARAVPLTP